MEPTTKPNCPMCGREVKQLELFENKEEFCSTGCEMVYRTGGAKVLMERVKTE